LKNALTILNGNHNFPAAAAAAAAAVGLPGVRMGFDAAEETVGRQS